MSVWVDLLSGGGIGSALSAITGLVGGYLAKRENRLLMLETNKHEAKMAELDMRADEFQLEASLKIAQAGIELAQTEGEIEKELLGARSEANVNEIDAQGFAKAMVAAQKPTGYPFVDKFRAMTRPLLTWILFTFVATIFAVLHMKVGQIIQADTELLVKLYVYLVQSVIYLFIMAVSWWFMSRGEKSAAQIKGLKF